MLRFGSCMSGALSSCLLIAIASPALAQVKIEVQRPVERAAGHHLRVSEILGATVTLADNAAGGKVEDLVLDQNGRVDYLVVANADRYVLVPWGAATLNGERRTVVVDVAAAKYREVPTFAKGAWPDFSDTRYVENVRRFYKIRPGEERREIRRENRR